MSFLYSCNNTYACTYTDTTIRVYQYIPENTNTPANTPANTTNTPASTVPFMLVSSHNINNISCISMHYSNIIYSISNTLYCSNIKFNRIAVICKMNSNITSISVLENKIGIGCEGGEVDIYMYSGTSSELSSGVTSSYTSNNTSNSYEYLEGYRHRSFISFLCLSYSNIYIIDILSRLFILDDNKSYDRVGGPMVFCRELYVVDGDVVYVRRGDRLSRVDRYKHNKIKNICIDGDMLVVEEEQCIVVYTVGGLEGDVVVYPMGGRVFVDSGNNILFVFRDGESIEVLGPLRNGSGGISIDVDCGDKGDKVVGDKVMGDMGVAKKVVGDKLSLLFGGEEKVKRVKKRGRRGLVLEEDSIDVDSIDSIDVGDDDLEEIKGDSRSMGVVRDSRVGEHRRYESAVRDVSAGGDSVGGGCFGALVCVNGVSLFSYNAYGFVICRGGGGLSVLEGVEFEYGERVKVNFEGRATGGEFVRGVLVVYGVRGEKGVVEFHRGGLVRAVSFSCMVVGVTCAGCGGVGVLLDEGVVRVEVFETVRFERVSEFFLRRGVLCVLGDAYGYADGMDVGGQWIRTVGRVERILCEKRMMYLSEGYVYRVQAGRSVRVCACTGIVLTLVEQALVYLKGRNGMYSLEPEPHVDFMEVV